MQSLETTFASVYAEPVIKGCLSAPVPGLKDRRINIRLISVHGRQVYQFERLTEKQAFHENIPPEQAAGKTADFMQQFRQLDLWTANRQYSYRITKKGKLLSNSRKLDHALDADPSHNREKNYLLPEGTVVPPLVDLGVFTKEGKIVRTMTDKYRQIERFVEMVEDVIQDEPADKVLRIVDFGCGKSYLTFILYYYLTEVRHQAVEMTGLDLKTDVIEDCRRIAEKYGYTNLRFQQGDIADFSSDRPMDIVISLHACDTATDFALEHAMRWKSRYILSVPCCQHEINAQLGQELLPSITGYGILKERMAALMTDGLRADILKAKGYQVQMLEFIDFEHSPKNILIRARYTGHRNEEAWKRVESMVETFGIQPTLYKLMKQEEETDEIS